MTTLPADTASVLAYYQALATQHAATVRTLRRRSDRMFWARLLSFGGGAAAAIALGSTQVWAGAAVTIAATAIFLTILRRHLALQQALQHATLLHTIAQEEISALTLGFPHLHTGSEFADPLHPYTSDLDIFGKYSFFHYANRAATALGRQTFASYLQQAAPLDLLEHRRAAADQLAPLAAWRHHFQALGRQLPNDYDHSLHPLLSWARGADAALQRRIVPFLLAALPTLTVAALVATIFGLPNAIAGALVGIQAWWVLRHAKRTTQVIAQTEAALDILTNYAQLFHHIEQLDCRTDYLAQLHRSLCEPTPASVAVRRLSRLLNQLHVRNNAFSIVLQGVLLWDLQWLYRLERWQSAYSHRLPLWFATLQSFDALQSLATLRFNHPEWTYPTISLPPASIAWQGVAHPLLPANTRVANDLIFDQQGQLKLLTGSNMAGKSTLLRTIGLNMVLGYAGAPVCARAARLPLLRIYTAMRTQDSLHENTSSFFAELKRLQTIILAVEQASGDVFFLMDEILKGTNSNDRHTGAKALILQLIASHGTGIVATHDLELGALAQQSGGAIENLCMEVAVVGDGLHFDYRLRKGVSTSFNASYLMQKMGIKM